MSAAIVVDVSVFHFSSISLFYTYLEALWFGAYTFRIIMFSWWIDHPIIVQCPSLFIVIFFAMKYTLSDTNIATYFVNNAFLVHFF